MKSGTQRECRFLNPAMEGEFRRALETLALSHDAQKKAVSLNFTGEGKRNVSVGYVVENPIWKTSYRLVLGKEEGDRPFLQGWAVVENPSDEDGPTSAWRWYRPTAVCCGPTTRRLDRASRSGPTATSTSSGGCCSTSVPSRR